MRRTATVLGVLALLGVHSAALAQERQAVVTPPWSAAIGTSVWLSEGTADWRHEFAAPPLGSAGSRLRFEDTRALVLPWSSVRIEDVHHLRPDLQQDPSVLSEDTGGFGWQAEAAMTYTFWRGLGAEVGYRYWRVEMDDGDARFRTVSGSTEVDLEHAETERQGVFFGLFYRF